jgi:hypothetical protein
MFSIENQNGEDYLEADIVKKYCEKHLSKYQWAYHDVPKKNSIPVGSVTYCEKIYGNVKPDYYPKFMSKYFNRQIWLETFDPNKQYNNLFVKPADKYKKFNGTINFTNDICEKDDLIWCSEIVDFINEWRYYISNGIVIDSCWYDGHLSAI